MAVGYVSPHLPFIQPKKYWDMYDHDKIKLADNTYQPLNSPDIAIEAQHNSAELRKNYLGIPTDGLLGESLSKDLIHGYYASVSYMDAMIGKLIEGLEEAGLRDNTTIILWSDHGYFLGEHGFWCKHSTFYEAVQIPLIISSSKYSAKDNSDSFTELVDIYPTLCELAGITPPNYIQGQSLTPILENPKTILKDEVYTRYKQGEAVIDKNYSYTEFVVGEKFLGNIFAVVVVAFLAYMAIDFNDKDDVPVKAKTPTFSQFMTCDIGENWSNRYVMVDEWNDMEVSGMSMALGHRAYAGDDGANDGTVSWQLPVSYTHLTLPTKA